MFLFSWLLFKLICHSMNVKCQTQNNGGKKKKKNQFLGGTVGGANAPFVLPIKFL